MSLCKQYLVHARYGERLDLLTSDVLCSSLSLTNWRTVKYDDLHFFHCLQFQDSVFLSLGVRFAPLFQLGSFNPANFMIEIGLWSLPRWTTLKSPFPILAAAATLVLELIAVVVVVEMLFPFVLSVIQRVKVIPKQLRDK